MVTSLEPEPETAGLAMVTVTPLGAPETVSATLSAKPLLAPTESVAWAVSPACSESDPGATATLKPGTAACVMVSDRSAEWESAPEVPVTVMVELPAAAPAATARVNVDLPAPVTAPLENEAVTPLGRLLADSETAPLKPPLALTLAATLPDAPACTETEAGETARAKSGCAADVTVNDAVAECERDPDAPVTVNE